MGSCEKIVLMSSDGRKFEVDGMVALHSQTIKNFVEDNSTDNIPLPNVTGSILARVIEYCKRHAAAPAAPNDDETVIDTLKSFDNKFVKVDLTTLFNLVMAANYLDIKDLLNITCQAIADTIQGKSVEEVRQIFHLENDFTPDEEDEIRKANPWAFE